MAPLLETQNTLRRRFRMVLVSLAWVMVASHHAWSGQPEMMVSADGPFPTQKYGPGEGIYVGESLVSGETFHKWNLNVSDLAEVRSLNTSRHDDEFNVGVSFVFPGKPGDRKLQVTARLLDECGNVLESRSSICGDARNSTGNHYLGFYMPPARYNSETVRFKGCAQLRIHRVEVTLAPVK